MTKYDKMLEQNKKESKEKVARAIAAILNMVQKEEKIMISELTKRTGLSRGFFYKNLEVRKELEKALQQQSGKTFGNSKKIILDKAMEKQLQVLNKKIEILKKENEELKEENEKLKKRLNKKELNLIKNL